MIVFNDHIKYLSLKESEIFELKKYGINYIGNECMDENDLIKYAENADIIFNQSGINITRRVITSLPRLKAIIRRGIGYDNIDVNAATEKGISVSNTPGFCVEEVSTHAVGLLLAFTRKVPKYHNEVMAGKWDGSDLYFGFKGMDSLFNEVIGLIGFGLIGTRIFEKLEPFKTKFLIYDPYVKVNKKKNLYQVSLEKLLKESKYIILCCSLTAETFHLIDREQFKLMRKDAVIINVGRGKLINEQVLIEFLKYKKIDGAAIDVFEKEPLGGKSPLFNLDNLILSPHNAGISDKSLNLASRMIIDEIIRISTGKKPAFKVN